MLSRQLIHPPKGRYIEQQKVIFHHPYSLLFLIVPSSVRLSCAALALMVMTVSLEKLKYMRALVLCFPVPVPTACTSTGPHRTDQVSFLAGLFEATSDLNTFHLYHRN